MTLGINAQHKFYSATTFGKMTLNIKTLCKTALNIDTQNSGTQH